jgi:hypothetical protein
VTAAEAVEDVRRRAIELQGGMEYGLATHALLKGGRRHTILVALATPVDSLVVAIDAAEYDATPAVGIAHLLGFPPAVKQRPLTAQR